MNLLIIGAGGHGRVVKEIAEAIGGYERIEFIDDKYTDAIGKITDLKKLHAVYDYAIVAIGNNELRKQVQMRLRNIGYKIPILIHPTAYVAPSAEICQGTVVEPGSIINTNVKIGEGCIISVGAVIDHDSTIAEYCHINSGAVIMSMTEVEALNKVNAGEVLRNQ